MSCPIFDQPNQLVRAVVNLIDNALDSGAKQVSVRFTAAAEDLDIAVVDDGAGMGTAALERCWEGGLFHQKQHRAGLDVCAGSGERT